MANKEYKSDVFSIDVYKRQVPVLSPSYEKGISPLIQFDNVDFPDPDGPMMSTFSPG